MHICFVSTRRGSYFMTELLSAVSEATATAGHSVELVFDEFPARQDESVYVVIPHEFDAWRAAASVPDAQQRARTIALCTENPGTEWFEATYRLLPSFGAAVSINRSSAAELSRRGIRCEHMQLGYSPLWDRWGGDENAERPIDVLYLGAADPRRDPLLAGLGGDLWSRDCQFLIPPLEPRTRERPDFLKEADKYRRLRSAKILLNLHRSTSSALEWMRFLEAICNGCVVVSEPCLDNEPLVPGEHFVEARVEDIAAVANRLLDDPDQLRFLRERAYGFVRNQVQMVSAGERLAELAAELPLQRRKGQDRSSAGHTGQTRRVEVSAPAGETAPPPAHVDSAIPHAPVRRALVDIASNPPREHHQRRRLLGRLAKRLDRGRQCGVAPIARTPVYDRATPRVSVVTVLAGAGDREVDEALTSVVGSLFRELELLVLDVSPRKRARPATRRFLEDHPSLPAILLGESTRHGLGCSLNMLIERARGDYVFILNARGGIYPSSLSRLVNALDSDPHAIFSYPMIAVFDQGRPLELRSSLPWEPERLTSGNWIDAMALIRRERLLELGGYTTDPHLAGREELDLWCKCARVGAHGVHVPQVLGWHRASEHSGPEVNDQALVL